MRLRGRITGEGESTNCSRVELERESGIVENCDPVLPKVVLNDTDALGGKVDRVLVGRIVVCRPVRLVEHPARVHLVGLVDVLAIRIEIVGKVYPVRFSGVPSTGSPVVHHCF